MIRDEWVAFLRERIEARERVNEATGDDWDDAPAAIFVGRSARGIGVRPAIVEHNLDGTKTYMLTLRQARRALKVAEGR